MEDTALPRPQVALFQSADGSVQLEVSLDGETVWLTQAQMCELFGRERSVITKHITNVFNDGELAQESVSAKFAHTADDGKSYQTLFYNLDVIISIGYRVKSPRGVQFRQWATGVLRQHLVQGHTLNRRRLEQRGVAFEQAVALLAKTLTQNQLVSPEGEAVLAVVKNYARSWQLLLAYDEQKLPELTTRQEAMNALSPDQALPAIARLKADLLAKDEATPLFGQLRGEGLDSALQGIEQSFGGDWLYPNVPSRAAHLLYFVIKNHPFVDGNKRIGSFLFLIYLQLNQVHLARPVEGLINDNTLVALALLVAASDPAQKELMIQLIEHLLTVG